MHVIAGEKMNTYRIAVCDDDPVMREQLHSFCRELLDGEKLPRMEKLKQERRELAEKKKALTAQYRQSLRQDAGGALA